MLDPTKLSDYVRQEGGLSRRLFLGYSAALAALPFWDEAASSAEQGQPKFKENPFSLGVASGDPDHKGFVIWTKLAPEPQAPLGGMKPEIINVRWEVAEDEGMTKVVRKGTIRAMPQLGHSVHVTLVDLEPNRWYWYRFRAGNNESIVGRARTLPAPWASPEQCKFAFASCQNYEQGLFTAYEQMKQDDPDLVFFLGDYIYEYPGKDNLVRKHSGPKERKIQTVEEYRQRYHQYRADTWLQGMHAACPWFVTWDDHEFDNNYANDISEVAGVDKVKFLEQRAAAYQVYYEMMPLRKTSLPVGPDMQLYRRASYGRLAEMIILDTRQYRSDQPNDDKPSPLNEKALNPKNSILGDKQRDWLKSKLLASQATWNILAQQVMMGMVRFKFKEEGDPVFSMDQWPGYAHERMEFMKWVAERKIPNPIVLTGDIHTHWMNNLRVDDRREDQPIVATEFVGTSISSGGNGKYDEALEKRLRSMNPCVQFFSRERGYVRCTLTSKECRADYMVTDEVSKPGGTTKVRASFVVAEGIPGGKKV